MLSRLRVMRLQGVPSAQSLLVLPPSTAQMTALQRLNFVSATVPDLTALTALTRLSIGGLTWSSDVGTQARLPTIRILFWILVDSLLA